MPEFDPEDTAWDPSMGPYHQWLQDKNTAQVRHGNTISHTDERGHTITRHADGRQDVTINL